MLVARRRAYTREHHHADRRPPAGPDPLPRRRARGHRPPAGRVRPRPARERRALDARRRAARRAGHPLLRARTCRSARTPIAMSPDADLSPQRPRPDDRRLPRRARPDRRDAGRQRHRRRAVPVRRSTRIPSASAGSSSPTATRSSSSRRRRSACSSRPAAPGAAAGADGADAAARRCGTRCSASAGWSRKPLDPELTRRWVEPCLDDNGVRRDAARFMARHRPADLRRRGERLGAFDKPVPSCGGRPTGSSPRRSASACAPPSRTPGSSRLPARARSSRSTNRSRRRRARRRQTATP